MKLQNPEEAKLLNLRNCALKNAQLFLLRFHCSSWENELPLCILSVLPDLTALGMQYVYATTLHLYVPLLPLQFSLEYLCVLSCLGVHRHSIANHWFGIKRLHSPKPWAQQGQTGRRLHLKGLVHLSDNWINFGSGESTNAAYWWLIPTCHQAG